MKNKVKMLLRDYTIVPIFVGMVIICSILSPVFLTIGNLNNVLFQNSAFGVMAVGVTFVMINGYRDLSVGTLMGLCATLCMTFQKMNFLLGILVPVAVSILVGLLNGFLVSKVGISSLITTISTMFACRAVIYIISGEAAVAGTYAGFEQFGNGEFLGISTQLWFFILLLVVGEFLLRKTMHGRKTYAVGGNIEAAKTGGIHTSKVSIINFVICSLCACIAGILLAAKMNASIPTLGWPDIHMQVLAMVVLGGTSLAGGRGNLFFTLGGVLTISIVQNVMDLMGVYSYITPIVFGIIIILVLIIDKKLKPAQVVNELN